MKAVLVKNNGLFRRLRRVREAQERAGYDIDRQGDVGEVNPKNPGHDLMKLWDYIVGPVSDIDGSNGVDPVSGCIKEWHDYDKLSTTSRYPEKRDLRRVNLRNLKEVMEKLFAFFEGLSMQTDDARDGIDETMDYWARTGGPPKKQCP